MEYFPLIAPSEGENSDSARRPTHTVEFSLVQNETGLTFAPLYPPDRPLTFHKARNLSRQKRMCEGEDVSDNGAKNREVSVTGLMRQRERGIYEDVVDSKDAFLLDTNGWSGWVRVDEGEYRGPIGWDPQSEEILWRYKLDLVSTGESEYDNHYGSGIIE